MKKIWLIFWFSLMGATYAHATESRFHYEGFALLLGTDQGVLPDIVLDKAKLNQYVDTWKAKWAANPQSVCQRPALYEFLLQQGSVQGKPTAELCPSFRIFTDSHDEVDLEERNLVRVEYLMSGPGESLGSRLGHSMMRVVLCPENADCPEDLQRALNIGFGAQTDSGEFLMTGGVSGAYPDVMSVQEDLKTTRHLVFEELRDIISAPLIISPEQKRLFFYLMIERYWTYTGVYRFLTNNCASEALKIFKILFPKKAAIQFEHQSLLTPGRILEILQQSKIIEPEKIIRTLSRRGNLKGYLSKFHRDGVIKENLDVMRFCETPAKKRSDWIQAKSWTGPEKMQWHFLELACFLRVREKVQRGEIEAFWHSEQPLGCSESRKQIAEVFKQANQGLFTQNFKSIPQNIVPKFEEMITDAQYEERKKTFTNVNVKLSQCLLPLGDKKLSELRAEKFATQENLKWIGQKK